MNHRIFPRCVTCCLLAAQMAFAVLTQPARAAVPTALDQFVYANDPDYGYVAVDTDVTVLYTRYVLFLTSGSWRDSDEVDRTLWRHWLTYYVPHSLSKNTGLLIVGSGSNDSLPDFGELDDTIGPASLITGSVIAYLGQVPNQPLTFDGEADGRTEDALLAYSWKKFLENPADVTWPAHLPMTRAAVRAMDAVQDHMGLVRPGDPLNDFIVAGASKRGWTTWLTAVVENGPLGAGRVSAIIPIVIDALNTEMSFDHHFKVYGFWAPAIHDYVDAGVMDYIGTPEMAALFGIIDPYSYLDRLTMPKFILNSAGDQFFLPDSWKFYYHDLPGIKWLRYFPNTDHSLSQVSDPIVEIAALYFNLADDGAASFPQYSWSILPDGTIELQTGENDVSVELWQASNPAARDFRLEEIGAAYTSTDLVDQGGGVYSGTVVPPADGWTAYMIKVEFSDGTAATTGIHVTTEPDTIVLRIRRIGADIELSFDSKPGEWYQVHTGVTLEDFTLTDSIIPAGNMTTWIDPAPAVPKKFYRLETITP